MRLEIVIHSIYFTWALFIQSEKSKTKLISLHSQAKGFNDRRYNFATFLLIKLDDFLADNCDIYSKSNQLNVRLCYMRGRTRACDTEFLVHLLVGAR